MFSFNLKNLPFTVLNLVTMSGLVPGLANLNDDVPGGLTSMEQQLGLAARAGEEPPWGGLEERARRLDHELHCGFLDGCSEMGYLRRGLMLAAEKTEAATRALPLDGCSKTGEGSCCGLSESSFDSNYVTGWVWSNWKVLSSPDNSARRYPFTRWMWRS